MSSHRSQVDLRKLKRNGMIVAEALARYMYNLSDKVIQRAQDAQTNAKTMVININSNIRIVFLFHKGSPKDVQVFKGQMVRLAAIFNKFSTTILTSSGHNRN